MTSCDNSSAASAHLCQQWDFLSGGLATSIRVPADNGTAGDGEWLIFQSGAETRAQEGTILSLNFRTTYSELSRIQIECDMATDTFWDDAAPHPHRTVRGADAEKYPPVKAVCRDCFCEFAAA